MEVNGLGSLPNLSSYKSQKPSAPSAAPAIRPETSALSPKDTVEFSAAGRAFDASSVASPARAERLAQIRAAIQEGTYDTPERMEAAIDRMFSRLGLLDE